MLINYQQIFQCLKGTGPIDLSGLSIPLQGYCHCLTPINCRAEAIDPDVVRMLTDARNDNAASFLTAFNATNERTSSWLTSNVGRDSTRILFSIRNPASSSLYGYMGLAYGDDAGDTIEGDAIVRYTAHPIPGLMRCAFNALVDWVLRDIGISEVRLRVLSDNPAIKFYEKCGFRIVDIEPLYEVRNESGELIELMEGVSPGESSRSNRTLTHMRYSLTY